MAEYIDREETKKALGLNFGSVMDAVCANRIVDSIPTADVAPVRHARWEECDYFEPCIHGFGTIRYANAGVKCTNCVHSFKKELLWRHNYCPNCGAKMDGGEENAAD